MSDPATTNLLAVQSFFRALSEHNVDLAAPVLADDVMEPLRPLVDSIVLEYIAEHGEPEELEPPVKRAILTVLTRTVDCGGKRFSIMTALGLYAANVRKCLLGRAKKLECPSR